MRFTRAVVRQVQFASSHSVHRNGRIIEHDVSWSQVADSKYPSACWHQSNVCKVRAPFGAVALVKHRGGGLSHTKLYPCSVTLARRWWCFVGQCLRSPQYARPVGQADKLQQAVICSPLKTLVTLMKKEKSQ